jgi:hypothetical protein
VADELAADGHPESAGEVEAALTRLADGGVVEGRREAHHALAGAWDTWWEITERGWLALAAVGDHGIAADELSLDGDAARLRRAVATVLSEEPLRATRLLQVLDQAASDPPSGEVAIGALLNQVLQGADADERFAWPVGDDRRREWVRRTLGTLALDGLVAGRDDGAADVTWSLTALGRELLTSSRSK